MELQFTAERDSELLHINFVSTHKENFKKVAFHFFILPKTADESFYTFFEKKGLKFTRDQFISEMVYKNTHVLATFEESDKIKLSLATNISSEINEVVDLFESYYQQYQDNKIRIDDIGGAPSQITQKRLFTPIKEFNYILPELYPDIDIKLLAQHFYNASERLLILYGIPGTGKTSFIKYLCSVFIENKPPVTRYSEAEIAYCKNKHLISSAAFWSQVTGTYKLVVLDDLDIDFSDRKSQDNDFTTNLLSSSDGLFCSLAPKVIISTNQTIRDIDAALVRPGRCFDFIELKPMPFDYALDIWENKLQQNKEEFIDYFKDEASILQSSFHSFYKQVISKEDTRSYLRNQSKHYDVYSKLRDMNISISSDKNNKFI